ncbi:MAG TPA: hypothetical protein VKD67_03930 [Acidimicrobiales bacterium]|nr:hypothetical protein [Acidimicrobiales bacterium]
MNTVVDAFATINDATLKFLTGVQERTLEANKSLASLVKAPSASIPSWLTLPDFGSPQETVKQGYQWRAKVLEANEKFVLELIDLWSPKPATATKAAK